jgi:hypothetical protein
MLQERLSKSAYLRAHLPAAGIIADGQCEGQGFSAHGRLRPGMSTCRRWLDPEGDGRAKADGYSQGYPPTERPNRILQRLHVGNAQGRSSRAPTDVKKTDALRVAWEHGRPALQS